MNWYKHYIGDFQRATGHLSLTERGAYRALMDHYYSTELPLPNDHAVLCRVAGAFSKAERDAVRSVMAFFKVCDSGLMHNRIEAELEAAG
ncbi:MAG: YdaU family protein, partial [Burkholderiaceae bacterium]